MNTTWTARVPTGVVDVAHVKYVVTGVISVCVFLFRLHFQQYFSLDQTNRGSICPVDTRLVAASSAERSLHPT